MRMRGARPQSPEEVEKLPQIAARGGVVMLAMDGSIQFTVQAAPPSVMERELAEGKGVRGEARSSK